MMSTIAWSLTARAVWCPDWLEWLLGFSEEREQGMLAVVARAGCVAGYRCLHHDRGQLLVHMHWQKPWPAAEAGANCGCIRSCRTWAISGYPRWLQRLVAGPGTLEGLVSRVSASSSRCALQGLFASAASSVGPWQGSGLASGTHSSGGLATHVATEASQRCTHTKGQLQKLEQVVCTCRSSQGLLAGTRRCRPVTGIRARSFV